MRSSESLSVQEIFSSSKRQWVPALLSGGKATGAWS